MGVYHLRPSFPAGLLSSVCLLEICQHRGADFIGAGSGKRKRERERELNGVSIIKMVEERESSIFVLLLKD